MICSFYVVNVLQTEAVGRHIFDITQLYAFILLSYTDYIYYKFTRQEEERRAINMMRFPTNHCYFVCKSYLVWINILM